MERFFILDDINTWYNWNLVLTAKDVTPPEPKTNYVELDGMSGSLDLSEALTGEITYRDRTITASFWTNEGTRKDRERLLREIRTKLHGRKIKIVEPDDPEHYFIGRVKIKSETNNLAYATIDIEATCDPWRYSINTIRRFRKVNTSDGAIDMVINNQGVKTITPTIMITSYNTTDRIYLEKDGVSVDLTEGNYKVSDIKFYPGVNVVRIYGSGAISFVYEEADL